MQNNHSDIITRRTPIWANGAVSGDVVLASDDRSLESYPGDVCAHSIYVETIPVGGTLVVEMFDELTQDVVQYTFSALEIVTEGGVVKGQFTKVIASGSTCSRLVARY